jgi:hypothetical protein
MSGGEGEQRKLTQNSHSTVLSNNHFGSRAHPNSVCPDLVQEACLSWCLIVRPSDVDIHTFLWNNFICCAKKLL